MSQIISQVNTNAIPLSKLQVKRHFTWWWLLILTVVLSVFIVSIILIIVFAASAKYINNIPILKDLPLLKKETIYSFIGIDLLFIVIFSFYLFRYKKFKRSKINLKGLQVELDDITEDKSVLDKNIRELAYILINSRASIVVFEDLDRFDNIHILTKLRELNFIVNNYKQSNPKIRWKWMGGLITLISKSNKSKLFKHKLPNLEVIKFVYMVNNKLFNVKNRSKFFDFIVPIIPIVDSSNSKNEIDNYIRDYNLDNLYKFIDPPSDKILNLVCNYINDIRILKSIFNEFVIYTNFIKENSLNLDNDKIFAIVAFKNMFPQEYDKTQNQEGGLFEIFNDIKFQLQVELKKFYEKSYINKAKNELIRKYREWEAQTQIEDFSLRHILELLDKYEKKNWIYNVSKGYYLQNSNNKYNLILDLIKENYINETYNFYMVFLNSMNLNNKLTDTDITYINDVLNNDDLEFDEKCIDINFDRENPQVLLPIKAKNIVVFVENTKKFSFKKANTLNINLLVYCLREWQDAKDYPENKKEELLWFSRIKDILLSAVYRKFDLRLIFKWWSCKTDNKEKDETDSKEKNEPNHPLKLLEDFLKEYKKQKDNIEEKVFEYLEEIENIFRNWVNNSKSIIDYWKDN